MKISRKVIRSEKLLTHYQLRVWLQQAFREAKKYGSSEIRFGDWNDTENYISIDYDGEFSTYISLNDGVWTRMNRTWFDVYIICIGQFGESLKQKKPKLK